MQIHHGDIVKLRRAAHEIVDVPADDVEQFFRFGIRFFVQGLQHAVGPEQFIVGVGGFRHTVGIYEQAVAAMRPYAVDVSSGIETDGAKDPDKMKAFVESAKAACKEDRE